MANVMDREPGRPLGGYAGPQLDYSAPDADWGAIQRESAAAQRRDFVASGMPAVAVSSRMADGPERPPITPIAGGRMPHPLRSHWF